MIKCLTAVISAYFVFINAQHPKAIQKKSPFSLQMAEWTIALSQNCIIVIGQKCYYTDGQD